LNSRRLPTFGFSFFFHFVEVVAVVACAGLTLSACLGCFGRGRYLFFSLTCSFDTSGVDRAAYCFESAASEHISPLRRRCRGRYTGSGKVLAVRFVIIVKGTKRVGSGDRRRLLRGLYWALDSMSCWLPRVCWRGWWRVRRRDTFPTEELPNISKNLGGRWQNRMNVPAHECEGSVRVSSYILCYIRNLMIRQRSFQHFVASYSSSTHCQRAGRNETRSRMYCTTEVL